VVDAPAAQPDLGDRERVALTAEDRVSRYPHVVVADERDAAMVKLFSTEMQARVVDRCLQLFGGYGYITEYPIARLYEDARVTRIYGGTSEVMKSIISKSMGL
jgi:alkylation response protein AidB-like acyl-CoA dehydrogenase